MAVGPKNKIVYTAMPGGAVSRRKLVSSRRKQAIDRWLALKSVTSRSGQVDAFGVIPAVMRITI